MDKFPLYFGLICGGFFWLILFCAGAALLAYSVNSKKKAGTSLAWPKTHGTICISEIGRSISRDEDGHERYAFYPKVEYDYIIAGQAYHSKEVIFGGVKGYNNSAQAQVDLAKYPLNRTVDVFYNPENPAEAVLEQAAGEGAKTALTMAIILLVLSFLIACPLLIGIIRNF